MVNRFPVLGVDRVLYFFLTYPFDSVLGDSILGVMNIFSGVCITIRCRITLAIASALMRKTAMRQQRFEYPHHFC